MIEKKGPHNWAARAYWYDDTGTRRSKYKSGFRTKVAAESWEAETVAAMTNTPEAPPAVTLADIHAAYLTRLQNHDASPRTVQYYKDSARVYMPHLGSTPVADITPLMVQQTVDAMRTRVDGTQYRAATVRGFYRALRAELHYAVKMGVIAASPCTSIDLPKQQPHEAVIYTGEQLGALLSALQEQRHPLYWPVSLCARYALRRGEALGARWCDVDFAAGTLKVRGNLSISNAEAYLKSVKTRSSETTIALSDEFASELRTLQKARLSAGMMIMGAPINERVIPFADLDPREFIALDANGRIYNPGHVGQYLKKFQKANGLLVSGWHDLRHTYGTLMAEAGVDVVTISKAMRHSSVGITSDQYIDGTSQIKRNATAAMDRIVQFPSVQ